MSQLKAIAIALASNIWEASHRAYMVNDIQELTEAEFVEELNELRKGDWRPVSGYATDVYICDDASYEYMVEFDDDTLTIMYDDLEVYFNADGSEQL